VPGEGWAVETLVSWQFSGTIKSIWIKRNERSYDSEEHHPRGDECA
jgi:hypothetical protein